MWNRLAAQTVLPYLAQKGKWAEKCQVHLWGFAILVKLGRRSRESWRKGS